MGHKWMEYRKYSEEIMHPIGSLTSWKAVTPAQLLWHVYKISTLSLLPSAKCVSSWSKSNDLCVTDFDFLEHPPNSTWVLVQLNMASAYLLAWRMCSVPTQSIQCIGNSTKWKRLLQCLKKWGLEARQSPPTALVLKCQIIIGLSVKSFQHWVSVFQESFLPLFRERTKNWLHNVLPSGPL